MNLPRLYRRAYCEPLCIARADFDAIHAVLWPRMTGNGKMEFPMEEQAAHPARTPRGQRTTSLRPDESGHMYSMLSDGVARVPIFGTLGKNLDALDMACGGCDVDNARAAIDQALARKDVKTLVLDIASPGGEVTGISELGNTIRAATKVRGKTIYAFSDSQMCSAAYWLGSQADEIICTPSATLGSIGVYLAWLDEGIAMQLQGYRLELFKAGDHKGMGLPGRALSQDDRNLLQTRVDDIYRGFTAAVTAARPKVQRSTMQGQTFAGDRAVATHLADGLVNDWTEFLSLL